MCRLLLTYLNLSCIIRLLTPYKDTQMIYKALQMIEVDTEYGGYLFHTKNLWTGDRAVLGVKFSVVGDSNPYKDAQDWANGKLVQDAFRYLYPDEREMLISGMLPEDWENMDNLGE